MRWCEVRDSVKKAPTACLVKFSQGMRLQHLLKDMSGSQELSCITTPGSQKVPLGSHGPTLPASSSNTMLSLLLGSHSSVKPSLIAAGRDFFLFKLLIIIVPTIPGTTNQMLPEVAFFFFFLSGFCIAGLNCCFTNCHPPLHMLGLSLPIWTSSSLRVVTLLQSLGNLGTPLMPPPPSRSDHSLPPSP